MSTVEVGGVEPDDVAVAAVFERLRGVDPGASIRLEEIEAPGRRMARNGFACEAELAGSDPDSDPPASGRFIVLHDPAGKPDWQGSWRVIAQLSAAVDQDMGRDPLLAEVTWSWLLDALATRELLTAAERGTVTVTASRRFGTGRGTVTARSDTPADGDEDDCDVELRCSWSPVSEAQLPEHLLAFCDLLRTVAGVPAPADALSQSPPPPASPASPASLAPPALPVLPSEVVLLRPR